MQNVIAAVARFADQDDGQDLLEYGLLAVLIAVVAMVAVTTVGQQITTVFWNGIAQNF
ncbi:MAG: Flp family type IVb pilin [Acidobacteria bacterium]|nr:MAG: Flp family type IVb pilin [Acidobacteriota bacterium]PYQ88145.1 MAG: Flp family type IVb pilin [Acidobacteriota bacterium]PYR08620.1 MAG: Flp family type IVb pilin [Acidobacteriota bacterium]